MGEDLIEGTAPVSGILKLILGAGDLLSFHPVGDPIRLALWCSRETMLPTLNLVRRDVY